MNYVRRSRRAFLALGATSLAAPVLVALGAACGDDEAGTAYEAASDVAWNWFELIYELVRAERTAPPPAARIYGITAVALYESIIAGSEKNRPLAGQLNGLTAVPRPSSKDLHWPTVANAALAQTVRGLYPSLSRPSRDAVEILELDFNNAPGEPADKLERSRRYGLDVAASVLGWALTDGMWSKSGASYRAVSVAGAWQPTPPQFNATPVEPHWGDIRPMGIASASDFTPPGHPPFLSSAGSEFYKAAIEVYNVGRGLSDEQKVIANYWADNPGVTGTPPGHWISIISQIARNERLSLMAAAEAYAGAGIAAHDAFVCCWNTKYATNLQRPVTFINANIDPDWSPLLVTPNFPTYTSGHSSQSGAIATVLTSIFGRKRFRDSVHEDHNLQPSLQSRTFASFNDAAAEAAVSRLYGGIHYAFDNEDGFAAGKAIGQAILKRVQFKA
jgi:hypothetical protein